MDWSKYWPQNCHLIKILFSLSLDMYPKPNLLSGKYSDIKTLHRDSETPRKSLAGLYKPSVQRADREAVEQSTAVPCAVDPSFIFPSPSHLSPNPFLILVVPPSCKRTKEKGLIANMAQVQKNWMRQQVFGGSHWSHTTCFALPALLHLL